MGSSDTEKRMESSLETIFYQTDRVRLLYWRRFSGAIPTVYLVGLITVISFLTGMSNLSQPVIPLDGPLAEIVPSAELFARFSGVLSAFVLSLLVFGLNRRKRIAWYGTVVILPMLVILPLITFQPNDVPLLLMIVVSYPLLIINHREFDQPLGLSSVQIASLLSIIGVLSYASVGSFVMRDRYVGIETWTDAVYYVIVTIATVGYGDATPITQETKLFTLSFILLGTGAFTAAIGSLLIPAIESRMAAAVGQMKSTELALLDDHVLVLGYGELTDPLLEELTDSVGVLVVTPDAETASMLKDRDIPVVTADPTEKESLIEAQIDSARAVVVATEDDAQDVLAILAAKQVNPDIYVVAAAHDRHHIDKLESVGADAVISPTQIGGQMLGQSVLNRSEPVDDNE